MYMKEFTLSEMSMFIIGLISSIGGIIAILQHSKCVKLKVCCFQCERPLEAIMKDLENNNMNEKSLP